MMEEAKKRLLEMFREYEAASEASDDAENEVGSLEFDLVLNLAELSVDELHELLSEAKEDSPAVRLIRNELENRTEETKGNSAL